MIYLYNKGILTAFPFDEMKEISSYLSDLPKVADHTDVAEKNSRDYKAVKKKMGYCWNLTFKHSKTMIIWKKKYKYINSLNRQSYHHDKRSKCGAFNDMAFHATIFVAWNEQT